MAEQSQPDSVEAKGKRLNDRLDSWLTKEGDKLKLHEDKRADIIEAARKAGKKIYAQDDAINCLDSMVRAQQMIHEIIGPFETTHNFDADNYDCQPMLGDSVQYTDIKVTGIDRATKKPVSLRLDKVCSEKMHKGIAIQRQAEIGFNDVMDKLQESDTELQLLPVASLKLVKDNMLNTAVEIAQQDRLIAQKVNRTYAPDPMEKALQQYAESSDKAVEFKVLPLVDQTKKALGK